MNAITVGEVVWVRCRPVPPRRGVDDQNINWTVLCLEHFNTERGDSRYVDLRQFAGSADPTGTTRRCARDVGKALAGKRRLNRLELATATSAESDRYKKISVDQGAVDRLFVDLSVQAHATPPADIVLDLDATDDPVHGQQEGRFFHGYYGHYCYLPRNIFAGAHLLCARLRPSNIGVDRARHRVPARGALRARARQFIALITRPPRRTHASGARRARIVICVLPSPQRRQIAPRSRGTPRSPRAPVKYTHQIQTTARNATPHAAQHRHHTRIVVVRNTG